jgi:hypothetical protein
MGPKSIFFAIVILASAVAGYESTKPAGAAEEVFSFEMWCLEMRLYPAARCDARRQEDVKAYQQYRADVEQFDRQRAARNQRDNNIKRKLNPDSSVAKPATPVR